MPRSLSTACCASLLALMAGVSLEASAESRQLTRQGYALAYDLRFTDSLAVLSRARAADPTDSAPHRAVAAVTWVEMLCAQGIATFAAFEGTASGDVVDRPVVPEALRARFSKHIDEAIALAERARTLRRDDLDAQYELGASVGLRALYRGTVEGRAFAAFTEGRKAVALLEDLRNRSPRHHEAALLPGIYRFAVSTLPLLKRWFAAAAGMPGDRAGGIALLERAAAAPAATATDASIVLMIVYNREGRRDEALRHLRALHLRHPSNRLLRLNLAATELAAGDGAAAVRTVDDWLSRGQSFDEPSVPGERAMWLYIRGAGRVLVKDASARADLQAALQAAPREWIRARVHVELAKVALASGSRAQALAELDRAVHHARQSNDDGALAMAHQLRQSHLAR
jgi:tetratricopeptide (TPR) repeat protein